jgi:hypothetical protein
MVAAVLIVVAAAGVVRADESEPADDEVVVLVGLTASVPGDDEEVDPFACWNSAIGCWMKAQRTCTDDKYIKKISFAINPGPGLAPCTFTCKGLPAGQPDENYTCTRPPNP